MRPRKRGRKRRRSSRDLVTHVFSEKRTLASLARSSGISSSGMARRFKRTLQHHTRLESSFPSSGARAYVLLADALWFRFNRERWTLYLRALKPATRDFAVFLDPVLLPGKEKASDWRITIDSIPEILRMRVKAFVSDGFRGSKRIVKEYGWIFQRCHFHLIAQLQIRRGRRKHSIPGRQTREDIYQTARMILVRKNRSKARELKAHLRRLTRRRDCPRKLKSIIREFLRDVKHFRACLNHPDLNLPNTTNTIESMNNLIRNTCGKLRTPESLARWVQALIKHHSTFTCKGAKYQQN